MVGVGSQRRRSTSTDNEEADVNRRMDTVIAERSYKTFTVGIDENLDRTIDELKEKFGKTSRADVFRMGIALLKGRRGGEGTRA